MPISARLVALKALLAPMALIEAAETQKVGGQAVLEGVMMRGPLRWSVDVRLPQGEISSRVTEYIPWSKRHKVLDLPFIRGIATLFESLIVGYRALDYSAAVLEKASPKDLTKSKPQTSSQASSPQASSPGNGSKLNELKEANTLRTDTKGKDKSKESLGFLALLFSITLSLVMAAAIFVALPHLLSLLMGGPLGFDENDLVFHLIDGVIKFAFFLAYAYLIGKIPEISRVYSYHGAEHRAIYAYEAGLPLSPLYARHFPLWHPRCGTAFIFLLLFLSILLFAVVFPIFQPFRSDGTVTRAILGALIKLALTLPLAGFSYEISRQAGKPKASALWRAIIYPGLLIQRLTTRETDDSQLEVALRALREALDIKEDSALNYRAPTLTFDDKYMESCSTTTYN